MLPHENIQIVRNRKCFKCKKQTQVVAFGVEKYFNILDENIYDTDSPFSYVNDDISISPIPDKLPANFLKYLKDNFYLYKDYSFQADESYLVNHCQHCNAIQGNFYLFDEVNSPFFIDSIDSAKNLTLYRMNLKHDIILPLPELGFGSEDYLIKEYASIIDTGISLDL